jgi:hypothetical protein
MHTRFAAAALACLPMTAQAACYERDHLSAFLQVEHGLSLHSWGLTDAGDMLELFLSDTGHWATIRTTPAKCSSIDMPHQLHGRLWVPPVGNKAIQPDRLMSRGVPG